MHTETDYYKFGVVCSAMIEDLIRLKKCGKFGDVFDGKPLDKGQISAIYSPFSDQTLYSIGKNPFINDGHLVSFCVKCCMSTEGIEVTWGEENSFPLTLEAVKFLNMGTFKKK